MLARPEWQPETSQHFVREVGRLESLLRQRLGKRIRDLRLVEEGGALYVRGQVRTYYDKQIVQETLMVQMGPIRLINDLEVA
jgi:hypothetical protein